MTEEEYNALPNAMHYHPESGEYEGITENRRFKVSATFDRVAIARALNAPIDWYTADDYAADIEERGGTRLIELHPKL